MTRNEKNKIHWCLVIEYCRQCHKRSMTGRTSACTYIFQGAWFIPCLIQMSTNNNFSHVIIGYNIKGFIHELHYAFNLMPRCMYQRRKSHGNIIAVVMTLITFLVKYHMPYATLMQVFQCGCEIFLTWPDNIIVSKGQFRQQRIEKMSLSG